MTKKVRKAKLYAPTMAGTYPHQASSPVFKEGSKMEMKEPFVNRHGVVIGDGKYNSPNSPLNNWTEDTDPEIMAGDQWVHPTNDIGWNCEENKKLVEKETNHNGAHFMHPTKDTSYRVD
jgi:hypothetical protein